MLQVCKCWVLFGVVRCDQVDVVPAQGAVWGAQGPAAVAGGAGLAKAVRTLGSVLLRVCRQGVVRVQGAVWCAQGAVAVSGVCLATQAGSGSCCVCYVCFGAQIAAAANFCWATRRCSQGAVLVLVRVLAAVLKLAVLVGAGQGAVGYAQGGMVAACACLVMPSGCWSGGCCNLPCYLRFVLMYVFL